VDEDGATRSAFRVTDHETVLLLVDATGRIIHNERDEEQPSSEAARRLLREVRKLAQANSQAAAAVPPASLPLVIATVLPASGK
jgi:hypothetical protein